jgi:nucleoside phosphorylase
VPSVPQADVLIITAADGEDDAVRAVDDGAVGPWEEIPDLDDFGFTVWRCSFAARDGRSLRVALTKAVQMGTEASGHAAARLIDRLRPRCLAMCGVCAGRPGRTSLGDVLVASLVYRYDVGELEEEAGRRTFRNETITYSLDAQWKQSAERFQVNSDASWLNEKPRTLEDQEHWLLWELSEGRDPQSSPERATRCADWTEIVKGLWKKGGLDDGALSLSDAGRKEAQRLRLLHPDGLPERAPFRIHVAPMGTGSNLVRSDRIWEELALNQRHISGLDMEGSVIGLTAHLQRVPFAIVVKGVMDFAEPGRTQHFRRFAARAAAAVLLGFLRQELEPAMRSAIDVLRVDTFDREDRTNPGTLLNARYEVVQFFEGSRRRELDELERWCDDPSPVGARLFIGPGGAGKTRLFIEWAKRLQACGWVAGFLPQEVSDDDRTLLLGDASAVFVVVDYAEGRQDLRPLLEPLAQRPKGRPDPRRPSRPRSIRVVPGLAREQRSCPASAGASCDDAHTACRFLSELIKEDGSVQLAHVDRGLASSRGP